MHFSFLTSHLNTGLCFNCVRGTCISGLTKEILILMLWKNHCAQKLTTSFNYTNNWKSNSIYNQFDCFLRWKKKVTARTHPNGRGPKGINGRQPGLQVDTKGCSFGASEVGSEEKGLLSTTTTEKLRLWDWRHDYTGERPVQNITVPSQITSAYPILLIWRLWRKSPFNCCVWLTWRNNEFSKQNLFSKQLPWPASGWARVCCGEQYTGHALAFGCFRRSWKIWRSLKWRRGSIQQQGMPDARQGWTPFCTVLELEKYSHAENVSCSACCRDWPGAGEDRERTAAKKIIYLQLPFANCSKRREGR